MNLSVWFLFCSPHPRQLGEAETTYNVRTPDAWCGTRVALDVYFKAKSQAQAHSADHLPACMQTYYFFG